MNLYRIAADLEDRNRPFVLATILESSGSTPRSRAKMIVEADGTCHGTIGGGRVETRVIEEALACMSSGKPRTLEFDLTGAGPEPDRMICGGKMRVLLEPGELRPRLLPVWAGHVNLALARAAAPLGFRIAVAGRDPGGASVPAGAEKRIAAGSPFPELSLYCLPVWIPST